LAHLAAVWPIALWYAVSVAVALVAPDGAVEVVLGAIWLLVLGVYCSTRPRRGELIGSIAVAPLLAAMMLSDLVGVPGWTVAYPGALVALVAIARIDRRAASSTPADTTPTRAR